MLLVVRAFAMICELSVVTFLPVISAQKRSETPCIMIVSPSVLSFQAVLLKKDAAEFLLPDWLFSSVIAAHIVD